MSNKYPKIGEHSNSFLRELEDGAEFCNIPSSIQSYGKKTILNYLRNQDADYRVIVNAMHMQDYAFEEQKSYLKELANDLQQMGHTCVIELHPADTTCASYHFHYWGNNPVDAEKYIINFVLENNLSNSNSVKMQQWNENTIIPQEELLLENEFNTLSGSKKIDKQEYQEEKGAEGARENESMIISSPRQVSYKNKMSSNKKRIDDYINALANLFEKKEADDTVLVPASDFSFQAYIRYQ